MSGKRADGGAIPSRRPSQGRLRAFLQRSDAAPGSQGPSTLPPPPFESETEVEGLEWWLGAHMSLASALLLLEQQLGEDAEPPSSHRTEGHDDAVRAMIALASAVRDSLYELYCDAADPRLASLVRGGLLETHVRAAYPWCEQAVALLGAVSSGLRTPAGPHWAAAKAAFREMAGVHPGSGDGLRVAVGGLGIDFSSPVEPLRGFQQDLEQLLHAIDDLYVALAKRFA
jgi:hypothetical protein